VSDHKDPTESNLPLLHTMFAETARLHGDLCAIECGDLRINYAALDQKTNQLAHYLRARGVGPDVLVAVLAGRSIDSIISILAILKAGGAFVPIPADLPADRIAFMLSDAATSLVLTDRPLDIALPTDCEIVTSVPEALSTCPPETPTSPQPPNLNRPENIAYCIYTSGSTGKPKGVLVQHSGLAALRQAQADWFGIDTPDRIMQVTSFGFDAFVYDLVMAFGFGATLVLSRASPGETLEHEILASRATVVTMPPSLLRRMDLTAAHTLRCVVSAGEPCQPGLRERIPKHCCLINSYGPTESTVWSSSYRLGERPDESRVIPIGRPIHGREIYITNEALSPAPAGEVGELCIGGVGLARGYLNRPDLTAEKFIPNPFGIPGSRLYRSGDLARQLPDGNIEFLGRNDDQVKIRGFRIELGEIESALISCPGVREVAVIAREDVPGHPYLAAYVCAESQASVTVAALRSSLSRTLPEYMVPAAWSFLEALPLTSNGKLDRKALPAPDRTRTHLGTEYCAPRTPTEKLLVQIWSQVLGIVDPGTRDGFHTLGGNSIQAIDVAFRVGEALGTNDRIPLPLGNTTISAYADAVERAMGAHHESYANTAGQQAGPIFAPSCGQTQIWFMEEVEHAWRAYRSHAKFNINGALDVTRLQRALSKLVARHETLRTAFVIRDGELECVVAPDVAPRLTTVDLSAVPSAQRTAELQKCLRQELDRRIDVRQPSLVTWLLVKLSETEHTLLQSEHHYVHDGQSFRILVQDLAEIYSALVQDRAPSLPPVQREYREFCAAERAWIRTDDFARQAENWVTRLKGFRDGCRLFSERRRTATRRFVGGQVRQSFTANLCRRLHTMAARYGITRFSLMFGVFGLLCSKLTGRDQMLIGTALSNRTQACYRRTVGMFVNMVPVPLSVERHTAIGLFLQSVSTEIDFAVSHSGMPLAEIVKRLGLTKDLKGDALFDVAFSFHDSLALTPSFGSLEVNVEEAVSNGSAKFDLTVVGIVGSDPTAGMELVFEYDVDCFDPATISSMASQYRELLESVLAAHDEPVSELLQVSATERRKLLVDWNDTRVELPARTGALDLFRQQVARTPRAVAVELERQALTYDELDRKANQLAHHLRDCNVGPDVPVAICLERSVQMVVALLGILKAGGAYVPLDPDYPQERLAFMLSDSGAPVLVTQSSVTNRLPQDRPALVLVDRDLDAIAQRPETEPAVPIEPQNLAYCIYTSGSTGEPKGVLIQHRSLANQLAWLSATHPMDATDAVLQKTPLSFDASVWEIFAPLCTGSRLVMARPGGHRDAAYLWSAVVENQITVLQLVPSMLRAYIEESRGREIRPARLRLFCGGESLSASLCKQAHEELGPLSLHNLYGPTETCIQSIATERPPQDQTRIDTIGRPIFNTTVYILDEILDPVPVGVSGELYIAGEGLARGYLNRPDLTARKFIPNPFGEPGSRMYSTGDLARYREGGTIEFLGRNDDQVKVRGFRIELGEIESALRTCPGVREAAVVAREDVMGEKRLVAYVSVRYGASVSIADLRSWLRRTLPEYMVPASWELLDALPLTPSGKLDRKMLPPPRQPSESDATQPTSAADDDNETVAELLRIMQSLHPADFSAASDFLDLGFDSLTLMRLVARCRTRFGVPLTLMEAIDSCNPRNLASLIESRVAAIA
jgi:amino acid adenylation domain-containing protein